MASEIRKMVMGMGSAFALGTVFLAKGGILSQGAAIVGEAGPEILSMQNGRAHVQPPAVRLHAHLSRVDVAVEYLAH